MEDQICRTNDPIKVMMAEIRTLLRELVGNVETSKPTRLEFRRFCGENPELWTSQAERYFKFYEISENTKLLLASSYLDGEALKWYQWIFRNKQLANWEHFTEKVLIRFRKRRLEPSKGQLVAIREYSTKINAQMFDKMSYGCCSKVFDTDQSDVKVISDTTTSTLNIAKSEGVHVFDGSSDRSKSESVSTFEIGQSVDDNSSITTASPSILDPLIRMGDVENSTTTVDKVINDNFRESDSLLQPSCDALQTEVTAATFDNTIGISLDFVPMTSLVVSIGYSQHVTPSLLRSFLNGRALELSELYQALTFTMALWVNEIVIIRDEPLQGVAAFTRKPPLGINSTFSIPCDMAMFDIHGKMMLNASMRTTEVEYPFDGALCLRTIPFLRNFPEERNLFEFWLSKSRKRAMEKKMRGMLRALAEDYSKQYIVFDLGPYLDYAAPNIVESTFEDGKSAESSRKVSFVVVHYADKMETIIWLLHICLSTFLEDCVICNQVHESYCQRVYVTKSHALCASRAMAEKSMLAKVGQVMDSYFSALESDVSMNYRAFLSWFTMLKMLNDTFLWSNYIYKGVSGGLSLRGMRNLTKGLLEFKLSIICGVLRVYDSICLRVLDKIAVEGSLKKLLFQLAYSSMLWTKEKGPRQCATTSRWSFMVFVKSKFVFPGCLGFLLCEVATTLKHVTEFLEMICCCSLSQGYVFCKAITIMELLNILLTIAQLGMAALGGRHSTNTILESNLEDKVLIEDGSIVMNQSQPDVYTCKQAAIGPRNRTKRPSQRLSWIQAQLATI
ncbi:hypothetical protein A4A49_61228 [Nicotiana attenuata]|uniref:Retrotransposon gag domain-containing protein n=1 Tax=Nicotiana attenuata TaxID=49451 RepID=A0A314L5G1_NICAT|nr:hypothetical protein A4A49_61228 [Nicotiana attenuata]